MDIDFEDTLHTRMWELQSASIVNTERVANRICRKVLQHIPALYAGELFRVVSRNQMLEETALMSLLHQTPIGIKKWREYESTSTKFFDERNNKENLLVFESNMPEAPQTQDILDQILALNTQYDDDLLDLVVLPAPLDEELIDLLISKEIDIIKLLNRIDINKAYLESFQNVRAMEQELYGFP